MTFPPISTLNGTVWLWDECWYFQGQGYRPHSNEPGTKAKPMICRECSGIGRIRTKIGEE